MKQTGRGTDTHCEPTVRTTKPSDCPSVFRLKTSCQGATATLKMDGCPNNTKRARMEHGPVIYSPSAGLPILLQSNGRKGAGYLTWVSDMVSKNKHTSFNLKNPAGSTLTIGDLDDTIYSGCDDDLNEWGKFYLPEAVSMQVIGVVEGTSCPCEQLVLMTCEDKKVYAYDGEELHEVASSLQQLCNVGIQYPASKSYYDGEAFKDMTDEDWAKVREGDVGKRLDQAHHQLVTANKSRFLEKLKSTRHSTGVIC